MYILPRQVDLFKDIQEEELLSLLDQLPMRNYPKGLDVFQQGEPSHEVYGILRGQIDILLKDQAGKWKPIATLKPGDFFGEFSFLTGAPRSSTAIVAQDSVLVEMSAPWLHSTMEKFESVRNRMLWIYRVRVLVNVLRGTKLFGSLSQDKLESLAKEFQLRKFKSGDEVLCEGDQSSDLYVLKKGVCEVFTTKNGKEVSLGFVESGGVLGEMALIQGQPRSASVRALKDCEMMLLPSQSFRGALTNYPELLARLEDLIKNRAEKTREILEAFTQEIVDESLQEVEVFGGLSVNELGLKIELNDGKNSSVHEVLQYSSTHIRFSGNSGAFNFSSPLRWTFLSSGKKSLEKVRGFSGTSQIEGPHEDGCFSIALPLDLRVQSLDVLQILAKAKLRGFVYPEYEVSGYQVVLSGESLDEKQEYSLRKVSQTSAWVEGKGDWDEGTLQRFSIVGQEKAPISLTGVCLRKDGDLREIQFEYESKEERLELESFIRSVSGIRTASLAIEETRGEFLPQRKDLPLLKRHFGNPKEFVKTYMTSLDQNRIVVLEKNVFPVGTEVRLVLSIEDGASIKRAQCLGTIESSQKGRHVLRIQDDGGQLKERLRRLCQKIIDERADDSWKSRQEMLHETEYAIEANIPDSVKFGTISFLLIFNIILFLLIHMKISTMASQN